MAQFRTGADLLDAALTKAGEPTSGTSAYETLGMTYMNKVYHAIMSGGTIPLTKDVSVQIDEVWPWSRSKRPLILELQPKYTTGSITLTQGSEAGTFSVAPTASVSGWYIKLDGLSEWLRIASHTAASTSFEIDGAYPDPTVTSATFKVVQLDYDLIPGYVVVDSTNNKIDFIKTGTTEITATLTAGTYTPADLATHVAAQMTTAAAGPTITCTYSATTRKFTITSDGASATILTLSFASGTNVQFSAKTLLGFDDAQASGALTYTGAYILGGIARIIEPFKIHKGTTLTGNVYGIDPESFQRDIPFPLISEGYPDTFTVIRENFDGTLTVRFNKYPLDRTRIEVEYAPVPRDLKDSAGSVPLIPRKHVDVLEDATVFYILLDKNDDKNPIYANLVQSKLTAMINQNRGMQVRTGQYFGQIIPRLEQIAAVRKLRFGYTSDA